MIHLLLLLFLSSAASGSPVPTTTEGNDSSKTTPVAIIGAPAPPAPPPPSVPPTPVPSPISAVTAPVNPNSAPAAASGPTLPVAQKADTDDSDGSGSQPTSTTTSDILAVETMAGPPIFSEGQPLPPYLGCSSGEPFCDSIFTMYDDLPFGTSTYVVPIVTSTPDSSFSLSIAPGPQVTSVSAVVSESLIGQTTPTSASRTSSLSGVAPTQSSSGLGSNPALGSSNSADSSASVSHQASQVIGGTVGGSIALLALFGLGFMAFLRRQRRKREMLEDGDYQQVEESFGRSWPLSVPAPAYNPSPYPQDIPPLTNPFADPPTNHYSPSPIPRFSGISGDGRLSRLSFSQFGPPQQRPLPTLDESSTWPPEPGSPLTPPPVIMRAAELHSEGPIERSVENLPENLGKLSTWLKENRRRSRIGSEDLDDLDDESVDSRHSLSHIS